MATEDFITVLFYRVDNAMPNAQKHSLASPYPSKVVTLAILFALPTTIFYESASFQMSSL